MYDMALNILLIVIIKIDTHHTRPYKKYFFRKEDFSFYLVMSMRSYYVLIRAIHVAQLKAVVVIREKTDTTAVVCRANNGTKFCAIIFNFNYVFHLR